MADEYTNADHFSPYRSGGFHHHHHNHHDQWTRSAGPVGSNNAIGLMELRDVSAFQHHGVDQDDDHPHHHLHPHHHHHDDPSMTTMMMMSHSSSIPMASTIEATSQTFPVAEATFAATAATTPMSQEEYEQYADEEELEDEQEEEEEEETEESEPQKKKAKKKPIAPFKPTSIKRSPELEEAYHDVEIASKRYDQTVVRVQWAQRELDDAKRKCDEAKQELDDREDQLVELELRETNQWNTMYRKLLEYKEDFGDCMVPHRNKDNKELNTLGRWVANQRVFYKMHCEGKTGHIKPHRIKALEKIGFVWNRNEKVWNDKFESLKQYMKEHDNILPSTPKEVKGKYRWLYEWIDTQRKQYRKYKLSLPSQMTDERVEKLNSIDFDWDPPPINLGGDRRRRQYGKLERIMSAKDFDKEEALAKWWDSSYQDLVEYKKKFGSCRLWSRYLERHERQQQKEKKQSQRLGRRFHHLRDFCSWNKKQYKLYVRGETNHYLTEERIRKMDELGFEWVSNSRRRLEGEEEEEQQQGEEKQKPKQQQRQQQTSPPPPPSSSLSSSFKGSPQTTAARGEGGNGDGDHGEKRRATPRVGHDNDQFDDVDDDDGGGNNYYYSSSAHKRFGNSDFKTPSNFVQQQQQEVKQNDVNPNMNKNGYDSSSMQNYTDSDEYDDDDEDEAEGYYESGTK